MKWNTHVTIKILEYINTFIFYLQQKKNLFIKKFYLISFFNNYCLMTFFLIIITGFFIKRYFQNYPDFVLKYDMLVTTIACTHICV